MANYSLLPAKPRKDHQCFVLGDVVGLNIAAAVLLPGEALAVCWLRWARRWLGPALGLIPTSPAFAVHVLHPVLPQTLAHAFRIDLFSSHAPAGMVPEAVAGSTQVALPGM